MKDRYKFRGYNDGWHYGNYIKQARAYIDGTPVFCLSGSIIVDYIIYSKEEGLQIIEVDSKSIGQCTGLKDKKDNLIYEGDIVIVNPRNPIEKTKAMQVIWLDELVGAVLFKKKGEFNHLIINFHSLDYIDLEVVGNVYENPELLEGR